MNFDHISKDDLIYKSNNTSSAKERIDCLEKILDIDPNDAETWQNLGNMQYRFDNQKATQSWKTSAEKYRKRIDAFKEDAIKYKKNPSHLQHMNIESSNVIHEIGKHFFKLGQVYQNLEEHSLATDSFKKAFELKPDEHICLYFIGKSLYDNDKLDESKKYLIQLNEKQNNFQAHYFLGCIYWNQDYTSQALSEFWKCIDSEENDSVSDYYRYMSYHNMENMNLAEQYLKQSIEKDPDDLNLVYEIIEYYEGNNQSEKAYKYYKIIQSKRNMVKNFRL